MTAIAIHAQELPDSVAKDHRIPFSEAVRIWARIVSLSFGGPAGQIAVMHRGREASFRPFLREPYLPQHTALILLTHQFMGENDRRRASACRTLNPRQIDEEQPIAEPGGELAKLPPRSGGFARNRHYVVKRTKRCIPQERVSRYFGAIIDSALEALKRKRADMTGEIFLNAAYAGGFGSNLEDAVHLM